jgi:peptidoglycan/xylan/chitin deacetylase (PgdA/CDA1 family)|tara:strand:+ start:1278 stop:2228 length:951 start_codon:yes stop_codon:yes gene_type:complete
MKYISKFPHGIMFHHFHDGKLHSKSQGSISIDDLYRLIKYIGRKNILNADEFLKKYKAKKLEKSDTCLTFDDGIKSQFDIALPVLEDLKIKSFFFIYTNIFEKGADDLEKFRYFRCNYFDSVNEFYKEFYKEIDGDINLFLNENKKKAKAYNIHNFYSLEDIKFRLIRDYFLSKDEYKNIMLSMIKKKAVNEKEFKNLAINRNDLRKMHSLGHIIGLHTHNHVLCKKLNYENQKYEYVTCISKISEILNIPIDKIVSMGHPFGSYNNDTLKVLKNLNIQMGFRSSLHIDRNMKKINNSPLEIARQDHSIIVKLMNR